jgi:hypothetical protein
MLHEVNFLSALLRRKRLDAELAAGADPELDPVLEIRAGLLSRARYRRRLARSVERLVHDIDRGDGSHSSAAVPVRRERLAQVRGLLLSLAGALRDVEPVDPRGVAMTQRLITDPSSPLYVDTGALRRAAEVALNHLIARSLWRELPDAPPLRA